EPHRQTHVVEPRPGALRLHGAEAQPAGGRKLDERETVLVVKPPEGVANCVAALGVRRTEKGARSEGRGKVRAVHATERRPRPPGDGREAGGTAGTTVQHVDGGPLLRQSAAQLASAGAVRGQAAGVAHDEADAAGPGAH